MTLRQLYQVTLIQLYSKNLNKKSHHFRWLVLPKKLFIDTSFVQSNTSYPHMTSLIFLKSFLLLAQPTNKDYKRKGNYIFFLIAYTLNSFMKAIKAFGYTVAGHKKTYFPIRLNFIMLLQLSRYSWNLPSNIKKDLEKVFGMAYWIW